MKLLSVENLNKSFASTSVLNNLSLDLEAGEIGCLLGKSGSGKSTFLRILAGFETMDSGQITIYGKSILNQLPPEERGIGFLFQQGALFPHKTVRQNIEFGLHALTTKEKAERVNSIVKTLEIESLQGRLPHELSGGQKQRVAIARSLAPQPSLLLLDEPFSSLDAELRFKLATEIRDILKHFKMTSLVVTHSVEEAFDMADRMGLLHRGKLEQWDTPYSVYHHPKTQMIAESIGRVSVLPIQVDSKGQFSITSQIFQWEGSERGALSILLRPEDLVHNDNSPLKAKILKKNFRGSYYIYEVEFTDGLKLFTEIPSHHNHQVGEWIGVEFQVDHWVKL